MLAGNDMLAVRTGRDSNPAWCAAVFYWFLNAEEICAHASVAFESVNVVEIISGTHASGFSECQIVYMEGKERRGWTGLHAERTNQTLTNLWVGSGRIAVVDHDMNLVLSYHRTAAYRGPLKKNAPVQDATWRGIKHETTHTCKVQRKKDLLT